MKIKTRLKKANWENITFWFVFATLVASTIFSLINVILSPSGVNQNNQYQLLKSDYVLMLIQCILGIVIMFLPSMLERKLKINVPSFMNIVFVIFLYAAIYLGEVRSFYYYIPHWDTVLHTFSGAMIGALGFSLVNLLNDSHKVQINLSPLFVAVFAFSFALALGALWEVYEFSFDGLLGLNMQKFAYQDGSPRVGRNALQDTMKDLIVDALGALGTSIMGYISLKFKKGWLDKFEITRIITNMGRFDKTASEKSSSHISTKSSQDISPSELLDDPDRNNDVVLK